MLKLYQLKDGYRYNSDSLLLVDFIRLKANEKVLDLGCGCGVIGLLLKQLYPSICLYLLDILELNIKITKENIKLNDLSAHAICEDFRKMSFDFSFDAIITNPPFYTQTQGHHPHKSCSKQAKYLPFDELLKAANKALSPRGELYFCYKASALPYLLYTLNIYKFQCLELAFVYSKNAARLVLIRAKKSSKSPCVIRPAIYQNPSHFELLSLDYQEK